MHIALLPLSAAALALAACATPRTSGDWVPVTRYDTGRDSTNYTSATLRVDDAARNRDLSVVAGWWCARQTVCVGDPVALTVSSDQRTEGSLPGEVLAFALGGQAYSVSPSMQEAGVSATDEVTSQPQRSFTYRLPRAVFERLAAERSPVTLHVGTARTFALSHAAREPFRRLLATGQGR